jgi:hypothetical protein
VSYALYAVFVVWPVAASIVMIRRIGKPALPAAIPDTAQELVDPARQRTADRRYRRRVQRRRQDGQAGESA